MEEKYQVMLLFNGKVICFGQKENVFVRVESVSAENIPWIGQRKLREKLQKLIFMKEIREGKKLKYFKQLILKAYKYNSEIKNLQI